MVSHLPCQEHHVTARTASRCQAAHHGLQKGRPCLTAPRANLASKTLIESIRSTVHSLRIHLDSKAKTSDTNAGNHYKAVSTLHVCLCVPLTQILGISERNTAIVCRVQIGISPCYMRGLETLETIGMARSLLVGLEGCKDLFDE